jgi:hypothetical protein
MSGKNLNEKGNVINLMGSGSNSVTPNDNQDLPNTAHGLYVTTGGDVEMVFADGTEDTWTVPDNFLIPMIVKRVKAENTTASGIKAIL